MQEFFVANNRVDISRNQIIREGEVIALEPKVLEVLRVLAENQGEVVSHQTLLDTVWPNIVVAPNALQRCIGQLRKALNDDGKAQRVIATHPKRGYSLLAPVTVRASVTESRDVLDTRKNPALKYLYPGLAMVLLVACSTLFMLKVVFPPASTPLQKFSRLSPLTATDASEFYSTFSPDGRYVAFSRKVSGLLGHMWLLDQDTGREIRLTSEPGEYGKPNWSTDGKQIAFLNTATCDTACGKASCVNIAMIFVPLALSEPQPQKTLLECAPIPFLGLEWLSDKSLAAIVNKGKVSEILQIDSQSGSSESLFKTSDSTLYSLSWSPVKQLLAVMQVHREQSPSMFLLSPETKHITQQIFTPPERYSSQVKWSPIWDQSGEYFLFSASSRLYLMDLQGNLHRQTIPTFEDISYPMFHPNGKSIAMTLGKVDTDVAELLLTESSVHGFANSYSETPFARSILREDHAQYQPNGNMIAFFSKRAGSRQIWLAHQDEVSQLSQIEDLFPEFFVWSPNGQQIAVSTERQLMLLDLKGEVESLQLPFASMGLYQWLPDNRLLIQVVDEDGPRLVSYDIRQNSYQTLKKGQSIWAQSNGKSTWFIESDRRLKHLVKGSVERVEAAAEVQLGNRFFLREQQLFMLSSEDDIWHLNLSNNEFTRLFHYPNTTVRLTDVSKDGQRMLISKQLSAKKEIVLLTPGKPL